VGNNLFGADIAGIVHRNISAGVLPAVLIRQIQGPASDPTNLTKPLPTDEIHHPCNGFIDDYSDMARDGTAITDKDRKITLIGDSISGGVAPAVGDGIIIEDVTYNIMHVKRDPAAAVYECRCQL
jgi:hypothetical protein|tara:strand:+ start:19335 stop:19709 length:375 start_codon:yes stop_codon:yes gene_type:complete